MNTLIQTKIPASWKENNRSESDSDDEASSNDGRKKSRAPLLWTRVKSLKQMLSQKVMVYDADADMQNDSNLKTIRRESCQGIGSIIFDPSDLKDAIA